MFKKIYSVFIALCTSLTFIGLAHADEAPSPIPKIANEWSFELTPYVWAPGISSTLNYKGQYIKSADLSANNIISNLKSGAMLSGEAHYGNWGVIADVVSATLQKTSNTSVTPQVPYTYHIATKATL
jgi:hypothetical protein